ncbi:MAG: hypothetical protein FWH27_16645 [Planctomycetaceae bacterium]|nr:hypothetical protein [Planctomycetaceae bacterium]
MQGNFITDLLNDGYGIHTVAEWSGNSPRIILEHYVRILPSDFARASVTLPRNELQSLLKNKELHQEKCVTKSVIQEGKRGALNATSNKNPLFSRTSRKGKQGITWSADGEGFDENSLTCYFESEYSETANPHCAKTCEFSEIADFTPDDRESLETIFSLWSGLTPEMKSGFLHMIEAAAKVYTGR